MDDQQYLRAQLEASRKAYDRLLLAHSRLKERLDLALSALRAWQSKAQAEKKSSSAYLVKKGKVARKLSNPDSDKDHVEQGIINVPDAASITATRTYSFRKRRDANRNVIQANFKKTWNQAEYGQLMTSNQVNDSTERFKAHRNVDEYAPPLGSVRDPEKSRQAGSPFLDEVKFHCPAQKLSPRLGGSLKRPEPQSSETTNGREHEPKRIKFEDQDHFAEDEELCDTNPRPRRVNQVDIEDRVQVKRHELVISHSRRERVSNGNTQRPPHQHESITRKSYPPAIETLHNEQSSKRLCRDGGQQTGATDAILTNMIQSRKLHNRRARTPPGLWNTDMPNTQKDSKRFI